MFTVCTKYSINFLFREEIIANHPALLIIIFWIGRGSLFRTLHKNNQTLDIKRHLRMALDVVSFPPSLSCLHTHVKFEPLTLQSFE